MKICLKHPACAVVAVLLAVGALYSPAQAAPVYGTAAPHSGSRAVGNGLVTTGASDWDDATISWEVVENGDGTNTITYTFAGFGILDNDGEASQSISHVTLDISDDAIGFGGGFADPDAVTSVMIDGVPLSLADIEAGDFDGITGAVKFDEGTESDTLVYSFTTNRQIVYGDVFVKSGQVSLTNTGFGDTVSENPLDYIARPNGAVPEPSSLVLGLIACLTALATARRRSRR